MIFHGVQPPDGTNNGAGVHQAERRSCGRSLTWSEAGRIDAVGNRPDLPGRNPNLRDEPATEVVGDRHEAIHKRREPSTELIAMPMKPVRIGDVSSMLTMHDYWDTREPRRHDGVESRPVSRVHQAGIELTQQSNQPEKCRQVMPGVLVQREDGYGRIEPATERPISRHADNHVAHSCRWRIDEVDHTVLQAPNPERVHDVGDE
jgi:hypothetical protein